MRKLLVIIAMFFLLAVTAQAQEESQEEPRFYFGSRLMPYPTWTGCGEFVYSIWSDSQVAEPFANLSIDLSEGLDISFVASIHSPKDDKNFPIIRFSLPIIKTNHEGEPSLEQYTCPFR